MENILIIEDNKDVNLMLAEAITDAGYCVKPVFTGTDGIKEIRSHEYSLILLDLMLPYKSGDEILREMRQFSDTPVIVISAKGMINTKIDLLRLGADDYITKPFDLGEVIARIESNLRRTRAQSRKNTTLKYKNLILDTGAKTVNINGTAVELTAKEFMILELLLQNPSKVFTKSNIYETVWHEEYLGDDNAVKTHISNLRGKLKKAGCGEEYVETVWGLGYRLCK